MVARELILDPETPGLVHTTIACSALTGLADLAAAHDLAVECPDQLLALADRHGLIIPTWAGHGLKPCPRCTLVAAPVWAVAA